MEGDIGTWSHCGNIGIHPAHEHRVVMNEGPTMTYCNGTRSLVSEPPVFPTDGDRDERIAAWHRVAEHPAFKPCFADDSGTPLLTLMLARLDELIADVSDPNVESEPATVPEKDVYDRFGKIVVSGGSGSYKDLYTCQVCGALMGNIERHRESHGIVKPLTEYDRILAIKKDLEGKPHSRACNFIRHEHGSDCHSNCPTCHGSLKEFL